MPIKEHTERVDKDGKGQEEGKEGQDAENEYEDVTVDEGKKKKSKHTHKWTDAAKENVEGEGKTDEMKGSISSSTSIKSKQRCCDKIMLNCFSCIVLPKKEYIKL